METSSPVKVKPTPLSGAGLDASCGDISPDGHTSRPLQEIEKPGAVGLDPSLPPGATGLTVAPSPVTTVTSTIPPGHAVVPSARHGGREASTSCQPDGSAGRNSAIVFRHAAGNRLVWRPARHRRRNRGTAPRILGTTVISGTPARPAPRIFAGRRARSGSAPRAKRAQYGTKGSLSRRRRTARPPATVRDPMRHQRRRAVARRRSQVEDRAPG